MSQNKKVPLEMYEMALAMSAPERYAEYVEASKAEKALKNTDVVKAKLKSYGALQRKIDNQRQRLRTLEASIGSTSSNLTGMPSGGGNGESKTERFVIKKDNLERKIRKMEQDERELLDELEGMIEQLRNPDEQTVIEMRYIDCLKWWPICETLFSGESDYEENAEKYLKRTFKLHGSALMALSKIYIVNDDGD